MNLPIRALLLAAGLGTRLRPLTNHTPKCLVPIAGKPLLARWLEQLESIHCKAAIVNTHYLADQVIAFLNKRQPSDMTVQEVYEPELLGTAGTLLANQSFFAGSTGMLIHADNATDTDLQCLIKAHRERPSQCILTMLTFNTKTPSQCGIVETDAHGVVQSFHEKVSNPPCNQANGAVYVFDQELIDKLVALGPGISDFSTQVLPRLVGRIHTWHTNAHYLDIGTPDGLLEAQKIWPSDQSQAR